MGAAARARVRVERRAGAGDAAGRARDLPLRARRRTAMRRDLLVTYRRLTLQTARGFLPGLHAFLDRLEAQLDGRAAARLVERFDGAAAPSIPSGAMRPIQDNDVFHAIAHPARRAILVTLKARRARRERAGRAVRHDVRGGVPAPARARGGRARARAPRRPAPALPAASAAACATSSSWIDEFAAFFGQRLDALGEYLDKKHGRKR